MPAADIGYSVHTSSLAQHAYFNAANRQIGPGKNDVALFTVVPETKFRELLERVGMRCMDACRASSRCEGFSLLGKTQCLTACMQTLPMYFCHRSL